MKKFLNKFGIWGSLDFPIEGYAKALLDNKLKPTRWFGVQLRWVAFFFVVETKKKKK